MRFLLLVSLLTISSYTFANNDLYDCEITTYGDMSKAAKSWIPEKFTLFVIINNYKFY